MTGHVDEADPLAARASVVCAKPRSIVRPAPLLLREAVGVGAGEGPHQRRLAVIDVTRRWRRRACARQRRQDDVDASSSPGSTMRRSSTVAPSRTRAMIGGSCAAQRGEMVAGDADADRRRSSRPAPTPRPAPPRWPRHSPSPACLDDRGRPARGAGRRRCADHPPERDRRRPRCDRGTSSAVRCSAAARGAPGRRARASGWRWQRCDQVGAAGDDPRLRTAEQLVAAEGHQRGAVRQRLASRRLTAPATPAAVPAATGSSRRSARCRCRRHRRRPAWRARATDVRLDEALDPVVARVHLQHCGDVGLRPAERACDSRRGGCGWWCRRRRARAPLCSITSGMRKPPPISTLSPRLTSTCRPAASAASTSSTAAALLLTTIAASAPHSRANSPPTAAWREPRSPVCEVELDVHRPRRVGRRPTGARPRLVCSSTPVALITGVEQLSRERSLAAATADSTSWSPSAIACPGDVDAHRVRESAAAIARASESTLGGRLVPAPDRHRLAASGERTSSCEHRSVDPAGSVGGAMRGRPIA